MDMQNKGSLTSEEKKQVVERFVFSEAEEPTWI